MPLVIRLPPLRRDATPDVRIPRTTDIHAVLCPTIMFQGKSAEDDHAADVPGRDWRELMLVLITAVADMGNAPFLAAQLLMTRREDGRVVVFRSRRQVGLPCRIAPSMAAGVSVGGRLVRVAVFQVHMLR